jgi:SAM-dependent methyltransferase
MYQLHNYCRACGYAKPGAQGIKSAPTEKLIEVLDLGIQPLANDFVREGEEHAGYAPLKVLFCPRCSLAQLSVVVDPHILYDTYSYVTSSSQMMREHFQNLMVDIERETDGMNVLEIGSNDGRFLNMMKEGGGYSVTGVDPAENLAAIAQEHGIPTEVGLFGSSLASRLPKFDVVIARHVFCHVDNWQDFVRGLETVAHPKTLICIEVPYAGDTIKGCEFDTIYHEHLSYLTLEGVNALLADTSLRLHRVIPYKIHGGAILLMLRHKDRARSGDCEFAENITADDWKRFAKEAHDQIDRLKATVETLRSQGKFVAGLGASAKSTVWINACHFTRKDIAFIADNTPQKQYTFSPGTDIPVVDEGAILRELPDYVILFCWNFLGPELLMKFALARSKGVKFIVPVPKIEIV